MQASDLKNFSQENWTGVEDSCGENSQPDALPEEPLPHSSPLETSNSQDLSPLSILPTYFFQNMDKVSPEERLTTFDDA